MVGTLEIMDNQDICTYISLKNFGEGRDHSVTENQEFFVVWGGGGGNSMVSVRERTIPTERPPLVGEVIANLCG
jgi:hypothetical protein